MTDGSRPSPPYAPCVCGHVEPHHGKQELAQLPYDPRCQWRGCGCPHFLDRGESAGQGQPCADCAHPPMQHDDGGCMFPKWQNTGGTTCGCAAYEPTSNAPASESAS